MKVMCELKVECDHMDTVQCHVRVMLLLFNIF